MTETDKRRLILNTMLDLVAERGLQDTPMSLVAEQAGVSVGAIYHHFSGKEALLEALYLSVKEKFGRSLVHFPPEQTSTWQAQVKQVWLNAYAFYIRNPKETRFLEQYESTPQHQEHFTGEEVLNDAFGQLLIMIQTIIDAGHIKPLPMVVLNDLTLGTAKLIARQQLSGMITLDSVILDKIANAVLDAVRQIE